MVIKKNYSELSVFNILRSDKKPKYWWDNLCDLFRYKILLFLECFKQRLTQGYCSRDTWSMEQHLSGVISHYLTDFTEYPGCSPTRISNILKDVQEGLQVFESCLREDENDDYWGFTNWVVDKLNCSDLEIESQERLGKRYWNIFKEISLDFSKIIKYVDKLARLSETSGSRLFEPDVSHEEWTGEIERGRQIWRKFCEELSDSFYLVYEDSWNLMPDFASRNPNNVCHNKDGKITEALIDFMLNYSTFWN